MTGYGADTETSLVMHSRLTGAKTEGKGFLSPTPHYTLKYPELMRQARITCWDSPEARSLISRFEKTVIGKGLDLVASPVWSKLNLGRDADEGRVAFKQVDWRQQA
jgi:hypothetical protein